MLPSTSCARFQFTHSLSDRESYPGRHVPSFRLSSVTTVFPGGGGVHDKTRRRDRR